MGLPAGPIATTAATGDAWSVLSVTPVDSIAEDIAEGVGRVALAWSAIDHVLRVVLARLENRAPATPAWRRIHGFEDAAPAIDELDKRIRSHGQLMCRLRKAVARHHELGAEVEKALDCIGMDRFGVGLYARRNEVVHAAMAHSPGGQALAARVGAGEWTAAGAAVLDPVSLNALAQKLWDQALRLAGAVPKREDEAGR